LDLNKKDSKEEKRLKKQLSVNTSSDGISRSSSKIEE
jgi:hypothetical protein